MFFLWGHQHRLCTILYLSMVWSDYTLYRSTQIIIKSSTSKICRTWSKPSNRSSIRIQTNNFITRSHTGGKTTWSLRRNSIFKWIFLQYVLWGNVLAYTYRHTSYWLLHCNIFGAIYVFIFATCHSCDIKDWEWWKKAWGAAKRKNVINLSVWTNIDQSIFTWFFLIWNVNLLKMQWSLVVSGLTMILNSLNLNRQGADFVGWCTGFE